MLSPSAVSRWIQDPMKPAAWASSPVSKSGCWQNSQWWAGMKKAKVPSEKNQKTKKGLWAQAVEATPTVQIFIPEQLCWEFREDKASIL